MAVAACVFPACSAPEDSAATGDDQDVTGTAVGSKKELFEGEQYYVRIRGWDGSKMTPGSLKDEQHTANADLGPGGHHFDLYAALVPHAVTV